MIRTLSLTLMVAVAMAGPGRAADDAEEPMTLTDSADWQFRLVKANQAGPWLDSHAKALAPTADGPAPGRWPDRWRTFTPWPDDATIVKDHSPRNSKQVPAVLSLGGVSACRATLPLYTGGVLDFTVGHGAPWTGRWAWALGELKAAGDGELAFEIESAGPVKVWIDGKSLLQADRGGTHRASMQLDKGKHVLAAQVFSGPERWFFTGRLSLPGPQSHLQARCRFEVKDPQRFASITVTGPYGQEARLNGKVVPSRGDGLIGSDRRGLDPGLLKQGDNEILWTLDLPAAGKLVDAGHAPRLAVLGLSAKAAGILMGPVLSVREGRDLQIAVVTDARVPARLEINGQTLQSPPGLVHRFDLDDLAADTKYDYRITVGQGQSVSAGLKTLPGPDKPLEVAIVGDPQSGEAWKDVAAAVAKAQPDLVIIAGDFVVDGLVEDQWLRTFLTPAEDLLASVPFRGIPGNHDRYSPLLETLLGDRTPGPAWTVQTTGAMIVGIDGGRDYRPETADAKWLDRTLASAPGRRTFLVTHYPAYSSRNHGKLADDGRVLEWTSRSARNRIVPILARHDTAAMFAGHDHGYERSELPDGPAMIVTGGGGAGMYPKRDDAEKQNPHSKEFAIEHHYCLLRLASGSAELKVIATDGRSLDTRSWPENPSKETQP
ncbi:MAG: metallophosphoesterase family protein [Phycisphaerae bacterium]